jgi:hypothetical protein
LAETGHTALGEPEKEAIREQLNRLLASHYFSQSKRSVTFLRFITDHTLAGEAENIKERILGIEIFRRDPDYDAATDPVVRVTASEIRKRVAQYYQDPGHEKELRITLPSGSYIPKFHWPKDVNDAALQAADHPAETHQPGTMADGAVGFTAKQLGEPPSDTPELELVSEEALAEPEVHPKARAPRHFALILALICAAGGLLLVGVVFIWQPIHRPAFDFFWRPILTASDPVLLCVADQLQDSGIALRNPAEPGRPVWMNDSSKKNPFTTVAIDDLNAIVKVAAILQSSQKQYTIKGEGATNLADLRSGPSIFVGAFDNAWTLRLTNPLRFHFSANPDMTQRSIVNSADPHSRWAVDDSVQMATGDYRDYAIVARFTDSNTGKLEVVVAGIGRGGTLAAGQFLTDSGNLVQLERAAQAVGGKKNMEVVLSTQIIDGQPGSPKIEAVYFW